MLSSGLKLVILKSSGAIVTGANVIEPLTEMEIYMYMTCPTGIHSPDLALAKLFDKIVNAFTDKEHVVGIFMDFSKAFDTLNHEILLNKLRRYGVRGIALSWFKDYLSNRKQYVFHNKNESSPQTIQCGVPQGSILGPLLFLISMTYPDHHLFYPLFSSRTILMFFTHTKI